MLKEHTKEKTLEDSDDDDIMIRNRNSVQEDDGDLKVPERLNICQWIMIAILYIIFALLVAFIIYISCTWTEDRTNEYT